MEKMKKVYHERYYIFCRDVVDIEFDDNSFSVYEKFNSKGDLTNYLAKIYSTDSGKFNIDFDLGGNDTHIVSKGLRHVEGLNGYEFIEESKTERKRYIVGLEVYRADYADDTYVRDFFVVNPYDFKQIIAEKRSNGKFPELSSKFRNGPIKSTGKKGNRKFKHMRPVKHTAWYFTEYASYKEYGGSKPYEKTLDWEYHGSRESKGWKKAKIRKQWMKHLK